MCLCTEISFHFTLPKEGELIGPVVGATPPLINQLKQTLRHSTPIGGFLCHPTALPNVTAQRGLNSVLFFHRDHIIFWKNRCGGRRFCRCGDGQQWYCFGWKWRWCSWKKRWEAEFEDEAGDARWRGQLGALQPAEWELVPHCLNISATLYIYKYICFPRTNTVRRGWNRHQGYHCFPGCIQVTSYSTTDTRLYVHSRVLIILLPLTCSSAHTSYWLTSKWLINILNALLS